MVLTPSKMVNLGSMAADFSLPNTNPDYGGKVVALRDFDAAPALLVAFICNHCPYVVHLRESFAQFVKQYQQRGLAVVAINANDVVRYTDDGPDKMTQQAQDYDYTFPYLFDGSQHIAKSYQAMCTPDFFLYDANQTLVYRGQFDASRPGNGIEVNGHDLRSAVDLALSGKKVSEFQQASVGCSIKWKLGNEPDYL